MTCAFCIYTTHKIWDPTVSPFSRSAFCPGTFQNTEQFSYRVLDLFSLSPVASIPLLLCQQCKAGSCPCFCGSGTTFLPQRFLSSALSSPIPSSLCKSILGYVYAKDFSPVLQYCCRVWLSCDSNKTEPCFTCGWSYIKIFYLRDLFC